MLCENEEKISVVLNTEGGIYSVSRGFNEFFGTSIETIRNKPLDSFVRPPQGRADISLNFEDSYPREITVSGVKHADVPALILPCTEGAGFSGLRQFLIVFYDPPVKNPIRLSSSDVFREIFEQAAIGVALVSPSGQLLRANKAFEGYLGFSEQELQQMTFPEFTHPEDVDKDVAYYQQLIQGEIQDYQMEKRYITKEHNVLWVHLSVSLMRDHKGVVEYAVAVIKDIDSRKKIELELKAYKARLEKAFDGAREAVWHWLDVNGDEEWWSPSFYDILGYEDHELTPSFSTFKSLLHPKDLSKVAEAVQDHFTKNTVFDIDYRLKTKRGPYKWINAKGKAERDKDGNPTEMIGIITDIDLLKKAEKKLQRRNRELEESNKELEHFAYVASHDLQEPLRTINSFLQLFQLSLDVPMNEESTEYLNIVTQASGRMRGLIEDLLQYSRISRKVELGAVDIEMLLEEIRSDLTVQLDQCHGQLEIKQPLPVWGDKNQLYRLFNNLISNSLKFMKPGKPPLVTISSSEKGRRIEYCVSDNGIGISEEYHQTIFEIFKRLHTRQEYPGSGIGLSICKKIVELHDGQISIRSEVDKGTTFMFDLPKIK